MSIILTSLILFWELTRNMTGKAKLKYPVHTVMPNSMTYFLTESVITFQEVGKCQ